MAYAPLVCLNIFQGCGEDHGFGGLCCQIINYHYLNVYVSVNSTFFFYSMNF